MPLLLVRKHLFLDSFFVREYFLAFRAPCVINFDAIRAEPDVKLGLGGMTRLLQQVLLLLALV